MFPLWQKEGLRHSPLKPMAMKGVDGDRLRDVAKAGREIFLSTCSPARETKTNFGQGLRDKSC